jgi:DNA invertase Pin-like site-specific DNA recombinase
MFRKFPLISCAEGFRPPKSQREWRSICRRHGLAAKAEEFTGRMFEAINSMLLDMLAAVARKDYDDRRRRQAHGQAKAKAEGRYKGRVEDLARNAGIASMLKAGQSWSAIQAATGCSRAKIAKRHAKAA